MSIQQPAVAPPGTWSTLYERFRYIVAASAGSVVIGVTLPVLLVCWSYSKDMSPAAKKGGMQFSEILGSLIVLEGIATIFCGPGAIVLSVLLFLFMSRRKQYDDVHQLIKGSMIRGALASFLNFPGLLAGGLLGDNGARTLIQLIILFLVAGATCGGWVGWQVYRQAHPGSPFFPRYRLSTLLALVFAWALLLAIFSPATRS